MHRFLPAYRQVGVIYPDFSRGLTSTFRKNYHTKLIKHARVYCMYICCCDSTMFTLWSKILFACAALIGLMLLIKTVSKLIALYNNPNSVERLFKKQNRFIEVFERIVF